MWAARQKKDAAFTLPTSCRPRRNLCAARVELFLKAAVDDCRAISSQRVCLVLLCLPPQRMICGSRCFSCGADWLRGQKDENYDRAIGQITTLWQVSENKSQCVKFRPGMQSRLNRG